MKWLAQCVHRSFRKFESCADWLTGAAGPVFVTICVILVSIGMWTFFACMFGNIAPAPPSLVKLIETRSPVHILLGLWSAIMAHPWLSLRWIATLVACLFIVYSIGYHYYMAVREPPGSVTEGLGEALGERRNGPGSEAWWSRYRRRATFESLSAHKRTTQEPKSGKVSDTLLGSPLGKGKGSMELDREATRLEEGKDLWVQVKACQKCPRVPLWKAMACLPPELRAVERKMRAKWQSRRESMQHDAITESRRNSGDKSTDSRGSSPSSSGSRRVSPARYNERRSSTNGHRRHSTLSFDEQAMLNDGARGESIDEIREWLGEEADMLVPPPKPERTHHCSICDRCSLKFDHHCPWLNQCVGIGNERYFVLFMVWLAVGCTVVVCSGYRVVRQSISFKPWTHTYVPRIFPLLTFVLCAIMGFALGVMAVWQILIIGWGETSVENSDNSHYRELAREKDKPFTNVYDVGFLHNILLFFNAGTPASPHSLLSILAPWRIEPYSDGWHFAKKVGQSGRHCGITPEEELTDDETERDDAHPMAR